MNIRLSTIVLQHARSPGEIDSGGMKNVLIAISGEVLYHADRSSEFRLSHDFSPAIIQKKKGKRSRDEESSRLSKGVAELN